MQKENVDQMVAKTILNYTLQSAKDIASSLDSGNREEIVSDIETLMEKIKQFESPKKRNSEIHMDFSEQKEKCIAP